MSNRATMSAKTAFKQIVDAGFEKLANLLVEHNINKTTKYMVLRHQEGGMLGDVYLPSNPWLQAHLSAKEFFDALFPKRLTKPRPHSQYYSYAKINRKDFDEHLKLAKDNCLIVAAQWHDHIKKNGLVEYYQNPWVAFRMSPKNFFDLAIPDRWEKKSIKKMRTTALPAEDHLTLCALHRLTNSRKWRDYYLSKRDGQDLLSRPWDRLEMTEAEFFTAVRKSRETVGG